VSDIDWKKAKNLHVCMGCDRIAVNPEEDLQHIRDGGGISCCPERKMMPLEPILQEHGRLRAALAEIKQYDDGGFCGRIAHCALKGSES
jgi:hypothetical protein